MLVLGCPIYIYRSEIKIRICVLDLFKISLASSLILKFTERDNYCPCPKAISTPLGCVWWSPQLTHMAEHEVNCETTCLWLNFYLKHTHTTALNLIVSGDGSPAAEVVEIWRVCVFMCEIRESRVGGPTTA